MSDNRIGYIDLAKGICISFVVFMHIASWYYEEENVIYNALNISLMPCFFLLSGLFANPRIPFRSYFIGKVNKLLVPFISFHFLSSFIWMSFADLLYNRISSETIISHLISFLRGPLDETLQNPPLWFLWCLFGVSILFYICNYLFRRLEKRELVLFLISMLCGIVGFHLGKSHINIPFFFDNMLTSFPFFTIGYLIKNYTNLLYPNILDSYFVWLLLSSLLIILSLATGHAIFLQNNFPGLSCWQLFFGALLGAFVYFIVAKKLDHIPFLSFIGRYSLIVLITHHHVYPYIMRVLVYFQFSSLLIVIFTFCLAMLSYFALVPICKFMLPHITAQKPLLR